MTWQIVVGDAVEKLRELEAESVHAIVTDPPYFLTSDSGSGFMGKEWDSLKSDGEKTIPQAAQEFHYAWACGALRVLKPGAHLVAFGGTRTYHRLASAIEDAGLELRDSLAWIHGQGFPKSLDISKAIDAAAGHQRGSDYEPNNLNTTHGDGFGGGHTTCEDPPATDAAKQWAGFGTALKPSMEPIVLARKPLTGTVAANVLEHGCGGLNIDGSRVEASGRPAIDATARTTPSQFGAMGGSVATGTTDQGRWPPNLLLGHSARCEGAECVPCCPVRIIGEQSGESCHPRSGGRKAGIWQSGDNDGGQIEAPGDTGTAARYFPTFKYTPKPSTAEREQGVEHMAKRSAGELTNRKEGSAGLTPRAGAGRTSSGRANVHPTVKPVALMQWLCRLITPPGGTVLDCFCGSGSTGIAALREGFSFVGIEKDPEYAEIARNRIVGDAPLLNAGKEIR